MTTRATPLLAVLLLAVAASAQDSPASYLDELGRAATRVRADGRALALAHAALASARAGRADAAIERAAAAVAAAKDDDRYAVEAHALAGAATARAGGEGAPLLEAALVRLTRLERAERTGALIAWLRALAEAPEPTLLRRALAMLRSMPADRRAVVLKDALPALRRLGAERDAAAIGTELLHARLELLYLPDVVVALDTLDAVPEWAAGAVWERLASCAPDIDEFTVPAVVVALRGEQDPWAVATARADALSHEGHEYAALLVRMAGVFRLVDDRHPSAGARLEETLEAAWSFPPGREPERPSGDDDEPTLQRMRVLYRLMPRIPEACPGERGRRLLERELERAVVRERHPYVVNELLGHVATAAEKLPAADAGPVLAGALERALREHRRARTTPALLFEAMAECARVAGVHGQAADGVAVVDAVAARASEAIAAVPAAARGDALGGPIFFPTKALFAASRAARRLGEGERAARWLDAGLAAVEGLDPADQTDLLVDALATVAELEGAERWAAARRVLARAVAIGAALQTYQVNELFAAAAGLVQ